MVDPSYWVYRLENNIGQSLRGPDKREKKNDLNIRQGPTRHAIKFATVLVSVYIYFSYVPNPKELRYAHTPSNI